MEFLNGECWDIISHEVRNDVNISFLIRIV